MYQNGMYVYQKVMYGYQDPQEIALAKWEPGNKEMRSVYFDWKSSENFKVYEVKLNTG